MAFCKACAFQLESPEKDLHDPENHMGIVEGGVENEDAHMIVRDGSRGARFYCQDTGRVTKIVKEPPDMRKGEGGEESEGEQPEPKQPDEPVYDLPREKDPIEVLGEVVTSPFLSLSEAQVQEVKDWADDYDGQIPPDILEDILKNMSGVQKQTAQLARQKYEVKLNKWVRQRTQQQDGPPIGITAQPHVSSGGGDTSHAPPPGPQQEPDTPQTGEQPPPDTSHTGLPPGADAEDLREMRRQRRVIRRNNALDRAAEQMADQMAAEMAGDIGGIIGDARDVFYTAFKQKAQKDPDWFFEKMDEWDIDILDTILEPSETRKEEMQKKNAVDREIDDALDEVVGSPEPEGTNRREREVAEEEVFGDMEPDTESEEEKEAFEETFGDIAAEGGGIE